jgi:hypothetical protein
MPKQLTQAALRIIEALGGDPKSGKCFCPCHDDGSKPSLSVGSGDSQPVIIKCFGKDDRAHDLQIIDYLKAKGLWPSSEGLTGDAATPAAEERRSPDERRQYAERIWEDLERSGGRQWAEYLADYMAARGLDRVPDTAMLSVPRGLLSRDDDGERLRSRDFGMVLPVRNKTGKLTGIQVTWLSGGGDGRLTKKRDEEPKRQTYGLLSGNFVEVMALDYTKPLPVLIIGEGPETALAAAQLTGYPAIATGGKMANVNPPDADTYILLVDVDDSGGSRGDTGKLASRLINALEPKLTNCVVRLAIPTRPEGGKSGYDWDDALIDAGKSKAKLAKLAAAIKEAPTFEQVRTKEEKREARLNALAATKLKDRAAYEDQRREAADDLDWRTATLDDEVDRRVKEYQAAEAEAAPPTGPTMEQLAASARDIIASEDVLAMFADECQKIIAGEDNAVQLLYLIGTSRLFDRPMNVGIKGTSAAGKSAVRGAVLAFFPPEDVISFTAVSEKALLYYPGDFKNKILSMGEAAAVEDQKFQTYLLRELMSENKLEYQVAQKVGGAIETVTIVKNGPVAFMLTSTHDLDPEVETRLLPVNVDESEEQTRKVIDKIARLEGLNLAPPDSDRKRWQDFQRYLAAGERRVKIPFARMLGRWLKGTKSVRLRRDFRQLLIAIKAHALLHRDAREREDDGTIIANIEQDYAIVRDLMAVLMATAAELRTNPDIVAVVEAVGRLAREEGRDNGVTVRAVADDLDLDMQVARRRITAAASAGFLRNAETRTGRGYTGRFVVDEEVRAASRVLPKPADLAAAWAEARERARERDRDPEEPSAAQGGEKRR